MQIREYLVEYPLKMVFGCFYKVLMLGTAERERTRSPLLCKNFTLTKAMSPFLDP